MSLRTWLLALLVAALSFAAGAQDNVRLPDMGSSAGTLLSPEEAEAYGSSMLHQMRALNMVVDDPLLDAYLNALGYRLVAASAEPKQKFTFFVVKDNEINAFAAPGGYIGVNAGLITTTTNESELASVIAHEIGHITQNHLARAFEASRKASPLMALALLGAILAGAHSNGDAPIGILATGQGLLLQQQINFTRSDEAEADRVGIQTLARAGFDPEAMADFFGRMLAALRPGGGEGDVPELLRTHPVTTSRISDAKARAHVIEEQARQGTPQLAAGDTRWEDQLIPLPYVHDRGNLLAPRGDAKPVAGASFYALMRERVRVLASSDPRTLAVYYAQNLDHTPGFDTVANRYGYALALTRSDRGDKAAETVQPLLQKDPDNLPLRLAMADAEANAGRRDAALAQYADMAADSPDNPAIALPYARTLLANGKPEPARKAAALLKPLLDDSDDPNLYSTYGRACDVAGDVNRAAEAYADATYLSGHPEDALAQLKRLAAKPNLDYYTRARVDARIAELTPIVLELRRRGTRPDGGDDQGRLTLRGG